MEDSRLTAIENKLDKIQEVLVVLARIDERQNQYEDFQKIMMDRMSAHSDRISSVEIATKDNTHVTNIVTKVMWIVVASSTGIVAKMVVL